MGLATRLAAGIVACGLLTGMAFAQVNAIAKHLDASPRVRQGR